MPEFRTRLKAKGWMFKDVAVRWQIFAALMSRLANNPERCAKWDDACKGCLICVRSLIGHDKENDIKNLYGICSTAAGSVYDIKRFILLTLLCTSGSPLRGLSKKPVIKKPPARRFFNLQFQLNVCLIPVRLEQAGAVLYRRPLA